MTEPKKRNMADVTFPLANQSETAINAEDMRYVLDSHLMESTFFCVNGLCSVYTDRMNLYRTYTVAAPRDSIISISRRAAVPEVPEAGSAPIQAERMPEKAPYPAAEPIQRAAVAAISAASTMLPASMTDEAYLHIFLRVDRSPFMGPPVPLFPIIKNPR